MFDRSPFGAVRHYGRLQPFDRNDPDDFEFSYDEQRLTILERAMRRLLFFGLMFLSLAGGAAADNVMDRELVDLFANTCLLQPAMPRELNRLAAKAGFKRTGPEIPPELEAGPKIDLLYHGTLRLDEKVSVSGYFSGPLESPTVVCSVRSHGVTTAGLEDLVEHSFRAHDRTSEVIAEGSGRKTVWHLPAKDGEGVLEVRSYDNPPRGSITLTYQRRVR